MKANQAMFMLQEKVEVLTEVCDEALTELNTLIGLYCDRPNHPSIRTTSELECKLHDIKTGKIWRNR